MCTIEKNNQIVSPQADGIRRISPRSVATEKEETSRVVSQGVGSSAEGLVLRDSVAHSRELGEYF